MGEKRFAIVLLLWSAMAWALHEVSPYGWWPPVGFLSLLVLFPAIAVWSER